MEKEKKEFHFQTKLGAKDFWLFSMYHSNKGMMGLFALIFTASALFLLLTKWSDVDTRYRVLLIICALLFTVWQPGILYLKAKKQASLPAMQIPLDMVFGETGFSVQQKEERIEFPWTNMFMVVELPHMVILYTDSIHAYLLTDRILGAEKDAFLTAIHTWVSKDQIKIRKRVFL